MKFSKLYKLKTALFPLCLTPAVFGFIFSGCSSARFAKTAATPLNSRLTPQSKIVVIAYTSRMKRGIGFKTQVFGHPADSDLCFAYDLNSFDPNEDTRNCRLFYPEHGTRGQSTFYASFLENLLLAGGHKIIDRTSLNRLTKEQRFSASGLVDARDQIEFGKLAGADYLLIADGFCADIPYAKEVKESWGIKFVNLKTTEVIGAGFNSSRGLCREESMSKILETSFNDALYY